MAVLVSKELKLPTFTKRLSDFAVGESVFLNENGTPAEYLVVNQGIPSKSSLYDSSCDGTWLLRKDIYTTGQWGSGLYSDKYDKSVVNSALSNFLTRFDSDTQSAIKQVKIPYATGYGSTSVNSGANGLSTKLFLLSAYEVGFTYSDSSYFVKVGERLSYFNGASSRIAQLNGGASNWWLRTISTNTSTTTSMQYAFYVTAFGSDSSQTCGQVYGYRPAMVFSPNALFDEKTLMFMGVE